MVTYESVQGDSCNAAFTRPYTESQANIYLRKVKQL